MEAYTKDYNALINAQCVILAINQSFLNDTDYRVIREAEGGEPETEEDKQLRSAARVAIQSARAEIERLEEERRREDEERPLPEE